MGQPDVVLRDHLRFEDGVAVQQVLHIGAVGAGEVAVDGAIHDDMGHVDADRPKLARHGLGEGPQTRLGRRESRKALAAAHRGRGPGEENGATTARRHDPGRLPSRQKAREAGHFPNLVKDAAGGLNNAEPHVRADIEHHHLKRPDLGLDLVEQGDGFVLRPRVATKGVDGAAVGADFTGQSL